jgi:hypothetical protein
MAELLGPVCLLKQKRVLPKKEFQRVIHVAARAFSELVYENVRSFV